MSEYLRNYQLFAEGGESGSPAEGSTGGDDIPGSIPPRARENYRKAMAKMKGSESAEAPSAEPQAQVETETASVSNDLSYADLIKSDKYRDEHKAYMEKTIQERFKKYKGLEERQAKSDELLSTIAQKYGLDSASESFLDDLKTKVDADDSYYEDYAMAHDISTEEARRVVGLERKVAQAENQRKAEEQMRQEEAQRALAMERWNRLQANAEQTKLRFPNFNLENEMKDERFARLCAVNNDDTTAAYMACHWNDVINNTAQVASQQAQIQTANAIASGKNRPVENGMNAKPGVVVEQDFRKMNLQQLRAYAEEQRRMRR